MLTLLLTLIISVCSLCVVEKTPGGLYALTANYRSFLTPASFLLLFFPCSSSFFLSFFFFNTSEVKK